MLRHGMPTLFHPRVLRRALEDFDFPADLDSRRAKMFPWVERLRSGKLAATSEVQLHGPFLQGVVGGVLGYRTWDQPSPGFDVHQEVPVRGGKRVDGAIGWFGLGAERLLVPIELKGASQPLDSAGSRSQTPVEQAWGYANRTPGCRWILVSNYKETRLYSTARSMEDYESFRLDDLDKEAAFKRFYALLCRASILPEDPDRLCWLDDLLVESAQTQDEITAELYRKYKALRRDLFLRLQRAHPNVPALELIRLTQKLLDRFLFVSFAEDRGLLPRHTIRDALHHQDAYRPRPVWDNLKAVFSWVDRGNAARKFPAYNGGLFADDPELDGLEPDDATCRELEAIAKYDFREDVSVEVLGHIFEQSISDLEELREEAGGTVAVSKRKAEGVFYTPEFVTRYIVDETLGRAFSARFDEIHAVVRPDLIPDAHRLKKHEAWVKVWTQYRDWLRSVRVLDPACGSGAFLSAAFDRLMREYERVNASLADLREGQVELFDLDKTILNQNLFGMDLNPESVEITKLSLWLKTARADKKLTWLDGNIRCGNSVVNDPRVHGKAVDWTGERPYTLIGEVDESEAVAVDARWREGFDVVIGNPPYVRQELLTAYKEHWKSRFKVYDGVADIYVYFFELGLDLLKPGARLGYVVANKWLKAGYAAPLRDLLASATEVETLIDFGHAPIFPDADAFPSIITFRKAPPDPTRTVSVTQFPREKLSTVSVDQFVRDHHQRVPQTRLGRSSWSLEGGRVERLLERLRERGVKLGEYVSRRPLRGVLTGYNEAFLIDGETRSRLVREDPATAQIIQRFVRGANVDRWAVDWDGEWMIELASSGDVDWPWKHAPDPEAVFAQTFPAVHRHMKPHEDRLRKRSDKGRFWWELRSCAYYAAFRQPKIVYQVIQYHPCYAIDAGGHLTNDKAYFLPVSDPWVAATLNSATMWWHNFRFLPHMKDEALNPRGDLVEALPIPEPTPQAASLAAELVPANVADVAANHRARRGVLDVLATQYGVETPGNMLGQFQRLDVQAFVKEVLKRRGKGTKLRPSELADLRGLHESEALPVLQREAAILKRERMLSDAVNACFGLDEADVETLRETAPVRMPPGLPGAM